MAHSSQGTLPYCLQQSRSYKKIGDQKLFFFYNNVFINTVVDSLITTKDYYNEDIMQTHFYLS